MKSADGKTKKDFLGKKGTTAETHHPLKEMFDVTKWDIKYELLECMEAEQPISVPKE